MIEICLSSFHVVCEFPVTFHKFYLMNSLGIKLTCCFESVHQSALVVLFLSGIFTYYIPFHYLLAVTSASRRSFLACAHTLFMCAHELVHVIYNCVLQICVLRYCQEIMKMEYGNLLLVVFQV